MSVRFRSFVVFGAVALAAACSGPSSSAHPEPVAAANPSPAPAPDAVTSPTAPERTAMVQPAATEPAAMEPAASMSTPQVPAGAALTGEQVVEYVCSQCHSMEPPPLKAPPLTHLARHLRESFPSVDEAVTHVVAYAPAPDPEQSILPERAQERFGLMPPQPLARGGDPLHLDAVRRHGRRNRPPCHGACRSGPRDDAAGRRLN